MFNFRLKLLAAIVKASRIPRLTLQKLYTCYKRCSLYKTVVG